MLREITKTSLAILLGTVLGASAYAHPILRASNPGQDATVKPPQEIRLTFSENVIPRFSGLTIKGGNGSAIETAIPSIDPNDKRQLVVRIINVLSPGTYDVEWHAVSADTHRVNGHFSFKVAQ